MSTGAAPTKSPSAPAPNKGLDAWFELTKRGSTIGREVRGGLVTFFTMAYIIVLNPIIIGTGPDVTGHLINGMTPDQPGAVVASMGAVAAATALIAGLLTILMGVYGRFPIAIATGLGLNAMVAYTIAKIMPWSQAMGLVVWEGVLITILVLTGFRKAVFNAVPRALRSAISVGIGLFIAFIGLVDAGVVRKAVGPPVELGIYGQLKGWPIGVFLLGLLVLIVLFVRKVRGAMLIA
ncbi:MAG TPA: solute carrier family 23 protein, partial [Propionicimonas sp.]|nr:solute carrier family 23 protein [Propionicimonas sp.]